MGKGPKLPDPMRTAQAQMGLNRQTAIDQQRLNMIGQSGPWGEVSYQQTGMVGGVPQFTQTTSLSPEQQRIFDQAQSAQSNLAGIASEQSERVADTLSDPFQFTNQDAADWAYDLGASRILPRQQQNEQALRAQLINSGIRPGTNAYDREMARLSQGNVDQLNQLALQGRGQAFGEQMATRNQPLNELIALLSGTQVASPGQMSGPTPQTQVGGVDYTGLVQDQYQQQLQSRQAGLGGLFGLAGSLVPLAFSDERLKESIQRVGRLDNGLPVYSYRYKTGGPVHIGVMAQDVERVHPEAVHEIDGFKAVDYRKAVQ